MFRYNSSTLDVILTHGFMEIPKETGLQHDNVTSNILLTTYHSHIDGKSS